MSIAFGRGGSVLSCRYDAPVGTNLGPFKDAVSELLQRLDAAGPNDVMPVLLDVLEQALGASGVRLLMADVEERFLETWPELEAGTETETAAVSVDGSAHGQAYRTGKVVGAEVSGAPTLIAPITTRREREGVVEIRFAERPGDETKSVVEIIGVVLGYYINAADAWTDEFHLVRRKRNMALAAEIQWSLLPLGAFSNEQVALAGALEPAYEVGGDCFDYNCGLTCLTAGVFDAMGHGLGAARLSSLGVNAIRNARRCGGDIQAQARSLHELLRPRFEEEGFMTGILVDMDLTDPRGSRILVAGHPAPILQRGDEPAVLLDVDPNVPFGMPFDASYAPEDVALLPGDRLALYSDGIVEARPNDGSSFGVEGLVAELDSLRGASPREAARRVTRAVRQHRAGDLTDDATILIVDVRDGADEYLTRPTT